jgi:hypothetical protein
MRRVLPVALFPKPRPIVVVAPLVHAIVTVPVPSSGLDAFVTTGSYAPNARAAVLMVQLLFTEAVTLKLVLVEAALMVTPKKPTAVTMVPAMARRGL